MNTHPNAWQLLLLPLQPRPFRPAATNPHVTVPLTFLLRSPGMGSPAGVRARAAELPLSSPSWSRDLPLESASPSNCGNCRVGPKPSSAEGSRRHSPGQPTGPETPPGTSSAPAHPTDSWSFRSTQGPPARLMKVFYISRGNLFSIAPSTGR